MRKGVFAQTCQLAKCIGLHQSNPNPENAAQTDMWWSLFIIDVSQAISLLLALLTAGIEARIFHSRQTLSSSVLRLWAAFPSSKL